VGTKENKVERTRTKLKFPVRQMKDVCGDVREGTERKGLAWRPNLSVETGKLSLAKEIIKPKTPMIKPN
jgi:hypothetical protein